MARPWRRAIIGLAVKLCCLPHELLRRTDSVELAELFAFFALQAEELERAHDQTPEEIDASWRSILSGPKHA